MPLGRQRQRSEKQSSDGSLTDGLFDQLLDSLKQGAEPLPTDQEFRRELDAWKNANLQEQAWYENENLPWPLRRYWALNVIRAFTEENWLRLHQVIYEEDQTPDELGNDNGVEPLDEEQAKVLWLQWRSIAIREYQLEGLVTQLEE